MKRVNVIELMGRRGFPATESLYGQNILKTDLLRYLTNDSGVMWHFLGSNISDSLSRDNVTIGLGSGFGGTGVSVAVLVSVTEIGRAHV